MRQYTKKEIKKIERIREKITCDICNEEIKRYGYDNTDIKIEARIGEHYPESDTREYYRLDCCTDCFNKVMYTLKKELGAEFTEGRSDEFDYNGDEIED
ncbi:hypothetical protein D3C84_1002010 [compost metagenome]